LASNGNHVNGNGKPHHNGRLNGKHNGNAKPERNGAAHASPASRQNPEHKTEQNRTNREGGQKSTLYHQRLTKTKTERSFTFMIANSTERNP
jgi:hypothetical protein